MKRKKLELDQNNYYSPEANQQYFSVSQYKDFMKCEAMAITKRYRSKSPVQKNTRSSIM